MKKIRKYIDCDGVILDTEHGLFDEYNRLKKAGFLRAYDSTLIPVPTDESLKDTPGELKLSSNDLKDFINRVTEWTE